MFVFLPVALVVLFLLARTRSEWAIGWLFIMSIAFYAGWSPAYVPLMLGSIAFNFYAGCRIHQAASSGRQRRAAGLLGGAIAVNLLLLGYYKYASFLTESVGTLLGVAWSVGEVELPMGISFFTFTQIAFLVDARRGLTAELNPLRYGLFVTYYPHLVAGPILHHREMMTQFERKGAFRFRVHNLAAGGALFVMGLAKKVLIADRLAPTADVVFLSSATLHLTTAEAWVGALAYTLQIYFDFSGYSDMALGLALMMGIRLPLNFNSPYKSLNIIEFWRRWHITLSRFLRDYLYIPLGGNRKGPARRHMNLFITMVIGGLWHGAGWTFIIWGALHGVFLAVNHAWRACPRGLRAFLPRPAAWLLTFLAVVAAWVFFRADDMDQASLMLLAMAGGNGVALPAGLAAILSPLAGPWVSAGGTFVNAIFDATTVLPQIAAALAIALFLPNSQEIMARYRPAIAEQAIRRARLACRPTWGWGMALGFTCALSIVMMGGESPFLYFRF